MTEGILGSSTSLYILTVLALAVVFIQKAYENDYQFALVSIALTVTILTIAGLYVRKYLNSITN
jgi:hypothetical protein